MGLYMTALITLKMVVLAPMPRARERMTTMTKPGLLKRPRRLYRMSCRSDPIVLLANWPDCFIDSRHGSIRVSTKLFIQLADDWRWPRLSVRFRKSVSGGGHSVIQPAYGLPAYGLNDA